MWYMKRKMVSLAVCVLNSISRNIPKPSQTFEHIYNLNFPEELHKTVDSTFLEDFKEILVVGDVHGCYDELKLLLKEANATGNEVLKIFVGDLVNKGPKSIEVLDLVMESNSMLSVRGNHDEIVLREYENSKKSNYKLPEKYSWIRNLSHDHLYFLAELPYTISLPSLNSIVVHAGLIPGKPLEINDPYDMVHMRNIVSKDYFWERGLQASTEASQGEPWAAMWGGPQHVYFGHDAKRKLQKEYRATGLDTGCVYGNQLTGLFISGPRKGTFIQQSALAVHSAVKS